MLIRTCTYVAMQKLFLLEGTYSIEKASILSQISQPFRNTFDEGKQEESSHFPLYSVSFAFGHLNTMLLKQ